MISRIENLEKRVMQLEANPQVKVNSEEEKLRKKLSPRENEKVGKILGIKRNFVHHEIDFVRGSFVR